MSEPSPTANEDENGAAVTAALAAEDVSPQKVEEEKIDELEEVRPPIEEEEEKNGEKGEEEEEEEEEENDNKGGDSDSEDDDVEYSLNDSEEDLLPPFPLLIDCQSLSACANGLTRSQSKRHPPNPPSRAVNDLNAA